MNNAANNQQQQQQNQANNQQQIVVAPRLLNPLRYPNRFLDVAGRQEANKDAFMNGQLDSEIRYTLLKDGPGSFNAATQRAIALDAISKTKSSRLRGRRNGHVRWTKSEQDHDESVTADFRALNTSLSSGFNQMIEFQTRSFNKMLE